MLLDIGKDFFYSARSRFFIPLISFSGCWGPKHLECVGTGGYSDSDRDGGSLHARGVERSGSWSDRKAAYTCDLALYLIQLVR